MQIVSNQGDHILLRHGLTFQRKMGQTLTSTVHKVSRSISSVFSSSVDGEENPDIGRYAITPFVFKRTGYDHRSFCGWGIWSIICVLVLESESKVFTGDTSERQSFNRVVWLPLEVNG